MEHLTHRVGHELMGTVVDLVGVGIVLAIIMGKIWVVLWQGL